jgi:hypothetical protein
MSKQEGFKTNTSFAKDMFAAMSPEDQADFLASQILKGRDPKQLNESYGIVDKNIPSVLNAIETSASDSDVSLREEQELFEPLTSENTLVTEFEVTEYPLDKKLQRVLPENINVLLQSEVEVAFRLGKKYLQVVFANGTRVFTFRKMRGGKFSLVPVINPQMVDDFGE